jgi:hypothetical protein
MATGVVVAPKIVAKQVLPREVIIAKLKAEIFSLRYSRLENKYYIGRRLWQLQQLHAVAGHGTFLEDLEELDIPRTSAYRWIEFFQRVQQGYDPTPVRMTKPQRQKLQKLLDAHTESPAPEQSEEQTADEKRAKLAEAIAAAAEQVDKAKKKHKGKSGKYNVPVNFTDSVRTKFKTKYKVLGIDRVSAIIFKGVMDA